MLSLQTAVLEQQLVFITNGYVIIVRYVLKM